MTAKIALVTAVSLGKPVVVLPEEQVAHSGLAAVIAPCCAACWIVEYILKARPNQTIPSRNTNTTGSTSAASAISAPSAFLSLRASILIFTVRVSLNSSQRSAESTK